MSVIVPPVTNVRIRSRWAISTVPPAQRHRRRAGRVTAMTKRPSRVNSPDMAWSNTQTVATSVKSGQTHADPLFRSSDPLKRLQARSPAAKLHADDINLT